MKVLFGGLLGFMTIACANINFNNIVALGTESDESPDVDSSVDSVGPPDGDSFGESSSDETDPGNDTGTQTENGWDTGGDLDTDADVDSSIDADAAADADSDSDSDTDMDVDSNIDIRIDSETEPDTAIDTFIESDEEKSPDSETETAPGSENSDDTELNPDTQTILDSASDTGTLSSIMIDENLPGFCLVEGVIASAHKGYAGIGYADADNKIGAGIEWSVDSAGGTAELDWTYSTSADAHRFGRALINGIEAVPSIDFTNAAPGSLWTHIAVTVMLDAGSNTIRLESKSQDGLADIDFLTVTGFEIYAGSCAEDTDTDTGADADVDTDADTDTDVDNDADGDSDTATVDEIVIQEDEYGFCFVEGRVESEHSGYTGGGYANTENKPDVGIEWSVATDGGSVDLEWTYALGSMSSRSGRLFINGIESVSEIIFESTDSWDEWSPITLSDVDLDEGVNTIRLESTSIDGLPNIDYLKMIGTDISPTPCGPGKCAQTSPL